MNKEQFIAYMNQKLAIIKEEERKDIIDEYSNHIDEKVTEGMSEEEVIAGFGDIDEMIKEILDAYNIDPRQTSNSGWDRKINDGLDSLFDAFQNLLSKFTSMNADNVVKLMFEVLVVFIVLGFLQIPFDIIASIGDSLLRGLFGFGIGSAFGWIWHLLVKILYVVLFAVVLINVFNRRWSHFKDKQDTSMMDDVKESFNFEQAKEAVHRFTGRTHTHYETPYEEDNSQTRQREESHGGHIYHHDHPYQSNHRESNTGISLLRIFMKFFGFMMMLPFIATTVGLCCALGFLVVMSIQGITIIGFYFIIIGAIVGCSAVISLIDRYLCGGGRRS